MDNYSWCKKCQIYYKALDNKCPMCDKDRIKTLKRKQQFDKALERSLNAKVHRGDKK